MTKKIVLGGLAGAAIIFVWGFLTWVATGWRMPEFSRLQQEDVVTEAITNGAPVDGVYYLPWSVAGPGEDHAKVEEAAMKKMADGIFAFVVVKHHAGMDMVGPILTHLAMQFLACALVMWLLLRSAFVTFAARWYFVSMFGLAAGIACYGPELVWWHFPLAWTIGGIGEITVGFALAGLAMARIAK
ncbi:MAG: hypothetical protein ABI972_28580 [Acidobacteriota bacterium]